jgi:hypothetical protein
MERHLDTASVLTIIVTLVLFGIALVTKGLTHDLLLEAGVFLVSVKLILTSVKSDRSARAMMDRLTRIEVTLARIEQHSAGTDAPPAP